MIALFVCKCLNVALESDKVEENIDIGKVDLSAAEQRDNFFSEKLASCPQSLLRIQIAQPTLVVQRNIGRWVVNSCLGCGQTTHASRPDRTDVVLIAKALQTTPERVNSLKKQKNFSPVFNILVPEVSNDIEMKENVDTNNVTAERKGFQAHNIITSLSKQLTQSLQSQLEAVEEMVRQYREQKYAEYEAYRERAHRDHKILASLVSKARSGSGSGSEGERRDDCGPPSPLHPPTQRRRLSSFKDSKRPQLMQNRNPPPEEDSLEPEDVFDLEEADSHHMVSDQDDYDSDQGEDESNDEGIHMMRARGGTGAGAAVGGAGGGNPNAADLARSLPINVPIYPDRCARSDLDDDEEPQDIAASIKALARSVHGDPFELPRPRFSTQI